MSANKGYPSKERDLSLGEANVYVTAEPIREKQHGQSVVAHTFMRSVATDAVEANSTTTVIVASAHVAKVGDVINFTSGVLSGQEAKVQKVSTNAITLSESLASAPAAAVTFEILRHKYPTVSSTGALATSPGPGLIQYNRNGTATTVSEDTGTPANSRPLPVKLMGTTGDINITAGDLNVDIDHTLSSVKIGDGTDLMAVRADGSIDVNVISTTGGGLTNAELRATPVPVSGPLTDTELRATAVPISAASLPLPTGAATEATLDNINNNIAWIDTDNVTVTSTVLAPDAATETTLSSIDGKITAVDTDSVTIVSSALPTGAATEATIASIDGKINVVDTDDVTITASALPTGAATENTLNAINGKITTVDTDDVTVSICALPVGASTEATLSTLNGKVPANLTVTSTRLLVDGSGVTQPVSGTVTAAVTRDSVIDKVRRSYVGASVSTSAYTQLIASTAATTKRLQIFDSSGQTLLLAVGGAGVEVDKLYIVPGGLDIDHAIPSGSRISIKAVSATADVGEIVINLLG